MRQLAFCLLALAALDWPAPWLDRAGTALLGLGFAALAAGRVAGVARPSLSDYERTGYLDGLDDLEPVTRDLPARVAPYAERG